MPPTPPPDPRHEVEEADAAQLPDPQRFADRIDAFTDADRRTPPPTGATLFIGSSSIRYWHERIHDDLAPITVIARGFGGATIADCITYMPRIVLPYQPRAIVCYMGGHDLRFGVTPAGACAAFLRFAGLVHAALPACRITFLSIKPEITRWHLWPKGQAANALVAAACQRDPLLTYLDVGSCLLDATGQPHVPYYLDDGTHLSAAGYALWREIIRAELLRQEGMNSDYRAGSAPR